MEKESAKTLVRVLSVLCYIGGSVWIIGGIVMLLMRNLMASMMPRVMMYNVPSGIFITAFIIGASIIIAAGIFKIFVAFGLWNFRRWSRIAALVLAVFALFMFPIGTVLGAAVIYLLAFNKTMMKLFRN